MYKFLLLIIVSSFSSFGNVQLINSQPGKITLRLTTDTLLQHQEGGSTIIEGPNLASALFSAQGELLPAAEILLTSSDPSQTIVSITPHQKQTLSLNAPLYQGALHTTTQKNYTITNSTTARVPLNTITISPILSTSSHSLIYAKVLDITITYALKAGHASLPSGDFFRTLTHMLINPQDLPQTLLPQKKRSRSRVRGATIPHGMAALQFSIHDKVTPNSESETDLSQKNGLYKIVPSDLSQLGKDLPLASIHLRASNRHISSDSAPADTALPLGLVDIPLLINDSNKDGLFNDNDEIIFYGAKLPFWYFDSTAGMWNFHFNFYDYHRYYWITLDGGSPHLSPISLPSVGSDTLSTGLQLKRKKQSNSLTLNHPIVVDHGDRRWNWRTFTKNSPTFVDPLTIIDADTSAPSFIRLNAHFRGDAYPVAPNTTTTITGASETIKGNEYNKKWVAFPVGTATSVRLTTTGLDNSHTSNYINFDSYDLLYRTPLSLKGRSKLSFYSDTTAALHTYQISDIPLEKSYLLRLSPFAESIELIDTISSQSTYLFSDSSGRGYSYCIATTQSIQKIPSPQLYRHTSLSDPSLILANPLSVSRKVGYLIVAPQELLSDAVRLAQHKQEVRPDLHPQVVALEDVYRQFSGGLATPAAIRNMMIYAKNYWPTNQSSGLPDYLVLYGDGHYDYKGITISAPNPIIPYMIPVTDPYIRCAINQNYWGTFAGSALASLITGRIPVNNGIESARYLQKLIDADTPNHENMGAWRNRALLASDDNLRWHDGVLAPSRSEKSHTIDSDSVGATILKVNPTVDLQNIPLYEYPLASNNQKPLATSALLSKLSEGVGLFNYFGHGSPIQMADENLFNNQHIPQLGNFKKYFIFSAFSCTVGLFDFAHTKGMCEQFLIEEQKGAIATVASTRTAYVSTNRALGTDFVNYLFRTKDTIITPGKDTSITPALYSVGQALTLAKGDPTLSSGRKMPYAQLGDPSYRLNWDHSAITLSLRKIGSNKTFSQTSTTDTLKRLQTIEVQGTLEGVSDHDTFYVRVDLQNPERLDAERKDGFAEQSPVSYRLAGTIVTSKEIQVIGKTFTTKLFIPPNVRDTIEGSIIRAYAWQDNSQHTASGIVDTGFIFLGYDYSNVDSTDNTGPVITLHKVSTNSSGGTIDTITAPIVENTIEIDGFDPKSKATFFDIHFADPSGVDYFSSGPGEGVRISIESIMPPTRLTDGDIELIENNYRTIKTRLKIDQDAVPASGEYTLTITAKDVLKNETQSTYTLKITSTKDEQYTIGQLFAYPSPVRMGRSTQFFFNVPNGDVSDITLKIFTLQGQLVRNIQGIKPGDTWDLRDQRGARLSPNVYLYRLYVKRKKRDSSGFALEDNTEVIRSSIKKIMIHPPN